MMMKFQQALDVACMVFEWGSDKEIRDFYRELPQAYLYQDLHEQGYDYINGRWQQGVAV